MNIDHDNFEEWMKRIMDRFDQVCKLLEDVTPHVSVVGEEKLMDNHDLCRLLNVSKRTLQRYRSSGELPFQMIYHKTFYKEADVVRFIQNHFSQFKRNRESGNEDDDNTVPTI